MREEFPQSFPLPSNAELTHVYIESELKKAGINLQRIGVDGNVITVTTDKKIPKKLCQTSVRTLLTMALLSSF
jgi:hypothetical protein